MVAVMTMNVGYLMSILAGVFVGSMIFGRFMAYSVAH
jgi:copper transporter 1